ncbi:MAG: hypothetical protein D6798_03810 [Deltaproteobacteria bacterium]|nr:MAG: hypothetical protein D6798_03810 [Deltaproteobacteria bacterium]
MGGGPTGDRLDTHNDTAFAVLAEEGEGGFSRVGAALVSAWEVGITDLARVLEPRLERDVKNRLTERLSDALVPTQQPLNDARRRFAEAVRTGLQAGLASGRLTDATAPPVAVLQGLGAEVAAGWVRTTDYMAPLWEALPSDDLAERFGAIGPRLQQLFDEEAARFADAMAALPQGHDLQNDIIDACDVWYQACSRGVEITVYDGRTILVEAGRLLPERT